MNFSFYRYSMVLQLPIQRTKHRGAEAHAPKLFMPSDAALRAFPDDLRYGSATHLFEGRWHSPTEPASTPVVVVVVVREIGRVWRRRITDGILGLMSWIAKRCIRVRLEPHLLTQLPQPPFKVRVHTEKWYRSDKLRSAAIPKYRTDLRRVPLQLTLVDNDATDAVFLVFRRRRPVAEPGRAVGFDLPEVNKATSQHDAK